MTGQRLDRAVLIEAAVEARYERSTGHIWAGAPEQTRDCYRTECGNWLDAALPLIADAIEAQATMVPRETEYREGLGDGYERAGRLVRSLGGNTDGDR